SHHRPTGPWDARWRSDAPVSSWLALRHSRPDRDHRRHLGFADEAALHMGLPTHLPVGRPGPEDVEHEPYPVAWHDWPPELGLVDPHQIDHFRSVLVCGLDGEDPAHLGHRLDDQNPGHDGPPGEMALEER